MTTVTDAEGIFRFVGLQPATYTVKTELSGFVAQESQAEVGMGRTVTVDFSLKLYEPQRERRGQGFGLGG